MGEFANMIMDKMDEFWAKIRRELTESGKERKGEGETEYEREREREIAKEISYMCLDIGRVVVIVAVVDVVVVVYMLLRGSMAFSSH